MHIISWNVNGIRACLSKNLDSIASDFSADFFCIQETKASQEQVEWTSAPYLGKQNRVWANAEKKGYSGVAIFTPHKNIDLHPGIKMPIYDTEGRATIAFHKKFTLVNLYFPNGAASDTRHNYKMKFLDDILSFLKKLEKDHGPLVICGDYNIAHTETDIHDPISNKDSSGFKPEERAWMTKFLSAGFIDTFRHTHPSLEEQYSWWSYRMRSRERNKGWRIDYICVSQSLETKIRSASLYPTITGSDHCPIGLELAL